MKTMGRALLALTLVGCLTAGTSTGFDRVVDVGQIIEPPTEKPNAAPGKDKPVAFRCNYLITVTNDFVIAAYKNGKLIPETSRELLLDRFGATTERINVEVKPGDWLVFNVAHNPIRWGGTKYFAVAGCLAPNEFGFVSDWASENWSVCDDPSKAAEFIRDPKAGLQARALPIGNPWGEGDQFIKEYAGKDFPGAPLWGLAPSTWIKFTAGSDFQAVEKAKAGKQPKKGRKKHRAKKQKRAPKTEEAVVTTPEFVAPQRMPVQILSATYGTGGKNADVTERVREYVEKLRRTFSANPVDLGADPNPTWNKSLHIVYMKDGVRREQRRNENETILPESFYGPQDAGESRAWLPQSRWKGAHGELQFHADGTFTSPGKEGTHRWEAPSRNKLRLTWADQPALEFHFDHTWSSFSEVENARNVFHVVK